MNVVLKPQSYRNDEVKRAPEPRSARRRCAPFHAEVPADGRPYEIVICVMRTPRSFVTVVVVARTEADREVADAGRDPFRKIQNSLTPAGQKK